MKSSLRHLKEVIEAFHLKKNSVFVRFDFFNDHE